MARSIVSLTIAGKRLDPDAVTAALAVRPTESHHACDPALRRSLGDREWRVGLWSLRHDDVATDDIVDVAMELAERYENGQAALVGIDNALIAIGLMGPRDMGEAFCLEPSDMQRFVSLGLSLMVDVYD